MTLEQLFVVGLTLIGFWLLFRTGDFLNVRQTQPSIILLIRVLFVFIVGVLVLVYFGAIPNTKLF